MIENGFMDSISSELFSHFDVFVPCPLPSNIGRELFHNSEDILGWKGSPLCPCWALTSQELLCYSSDT